MSEADAWVAKLATDTNGLNIALRGYDPADWREAVRLLAKLRAATEVLAGLDASLVGWLYLHGEHGLHQQVEGVAGEVHITRGRKSERWEGEAAVTDYVDAKMRVLEGELPDPLEVMRWVLEVVPVYASTSLRRTPLRAAGLDVADYYTSEPGKPQVSLLPKG